MFDDNNNAFNKFSNLDSIQDRIIYYLLSPIGKTEKQLKYVHTLWKLLYYNDIDALNNPLPSYANVKALISNSTTEETPYRIFRSPYLSEGWTEECSLIKIYIDGIVPVNHLIANVFIGIDVLCHSKLINVRVSEDDDDTLLDCFDGTEIKIEYKSRVDVMVKAILYLLNGETIQGIGKLQFNHELGNYSQGRYALWSHKNYEGFKLVLASQMSGVE